jgi:hypothetical protein
LCTFIGPNWHLNIIFQLNYGMQANNGSIVKSISIVDLQACLVKPKLIWGWWGWGRSLQVATNASLKPSIDCLTSRKNLASKNLQSKRNKKKKENKWRK